eukprot:2007486-Rhodomonas_salina.2
MVAGVRVPRAQLTRTSRTHQITMPLPCRSTFYLAVMTPTLRLLPCRSPRLSNAPERRLQLHKTDLFPAGRRGRLAPSSSSTRSATTKEHSTPRRLLHSGTEKTAMGPRPWVQDID